jgi:hypothetical protein
MLPPSCMSRPTKRLVSLDTDSSDDSPLSDLTNSLTDDSTESPSEESPFKCPETLRPDSYPIYQQKITTTQYIGWPG